MSPRVGMALLLGRSQQTQQERGLRTSIHQTFELLVQGNRRDAGKNL